MDRWADNHHCIDSEENYDSLLKYILKRNGTDSRIYYDCGNAPHGGSGVAAGTHYVIDPVTGWGIQTNVDFTIVLPGCNTTTSSAKPPFMWCKAGTCD